MTHLKASHVVKTLSPENVDLDVLVDATKGLALPRRTQIKNGYTSCDREPLLFWNTNNTDNNKFLLTAFN
jgi:hypothetical protein